MLIIAINESPPRKWRIIADKMIDRTDIQVRYRLKAIGEEMLHRGTLSKE